MSERERIELIIKCYDLTPSQFADRTGIQRASVSHILSGRNKPSLEVMQKIYDAFPSLDIGWLMTGRGDAPVAGVKPQSVHQQSAVSELFPLQPEEPVFKPEPEVQEPRVTRVSAPVKQPQERVARRTSARAERAPEVATPRRIKEIRIFYSDGTYEIMLPEK